MLASSRFLAVTSFPTPGAPLATIPPIARRFAPVLDSSTASAAMSSTNFGRTLNKSYSIAGPSRPITSGSRQLADGSLQLAKDLIRRFGRIHHHEIVALGHAVQRMNHARLVFDEAVVHVRAETHIHAALPMVERAAPEHHARHQIANFGSQVVNGMRNQR